MKTHLPPKMILSIQSHVAYGHAGNSAAVFPLQRLGFEVLPVHTVQFSNHTGHGSFKGQVFSAEHIQDVIAGLKERGVLGKISAVLSGYLGNAAIGGVILNAVAQVRELNPKVLYLCDPVMGDVGRGVFVDPSIPDFIRAQGIGSATITTPNQFEFELITQSCLTSVQEAVGAARRLMQDKRLQTVVITSLTTPDISKNQLGTLAVTADQAWLVTTPVVSLSPLPNGMGDAFASVFLGHVLASKAVDEALSLATSTLYALVNQTEAGQRDLPLIACQEDIVLPQTIFKATPVAYSDYRN